MRRDRRVVSFNMSRIRGKDTRPERALRHALHSLGLRYRLHAPLPGKPDVLFVRAKVAVFVDGAFWHGRDIASLKRELKVHRTLWLKKIQANVARDRRNAADLHKLGYRVMRFWHDEVLEGPQRCAQAVLRVVRARLTAETDRQDQ